MALINALVKKNGCTKNEARDMVLKCYNAAVRNMDNNNGNLARTMQVMLGVGGTYIFDLFAIGGGKLIG